MVIEKLVIKNYKMFKNSIIEFNDGFNIIVGDNDAGKSTILEAINLVLSGKIYNTNIQNSLSLSLFNKDTRDTFKQLLEENPQSIKDLPSIEIEAYLKLDDNENLLKCYKGSNNSLSEDAYGIKIEIVFNPDNSTTFKDLMNEKKIDDIPIELYKIVFRTFSTADYYVSRTSKTSMFIDATRREYSNILNKFVSSNFIGHLSESDIASLRIAYKGNKEDFINNKSVIELNKKINKDLDFKDYCLSVNLKDSEVDAWKNDVEVKLNGVSITNMGFGTQNMFKTQLVTKDNDDVSILLLEEPENSLSFANMSILINKISKCKFKQVFIATHSSYVANKLGLNNLLLINNGDITKFNSLNEHAYRYFMSLPGYNTLRLVLSLKTILVEGPADELIIQKAYFDKKGKLPIEDGIDVLSVGGIAFRSYCQLAQTINKKVVVVTDNDGKPEKRNLFSEYGENIKVCMEENPLLNTLEPCVLDANKDVFDKFKETIYFGNDIDKVDYQKLLEFMIKNKTLWALRVFESKNIIKYPQYIMDAIEDE